MPTFATGSRVFDCFVTHRSLSKLLSEGCVVHSQVQRRAHWPVSRSLAANYRACSRAAADAPLGCVRERYIESGGWTKLADTASNHTLLAKGLPLEVRSKVRLVVVAGLEPATEVKAGLQDGGESHGGQTKIGRHGKTHPTADGRVNEELKKVLGRRKGI